jgi:hypothetical protein
MAFEYEHNFMKELFFEAIPIKFCLNLKYEYI